MKPLLNIGISWAIAILAGVIILLTWPQETLAQQGDEKAGDIPSKVEKLEKALDTERRLRVLALRDLAIAKSHWYLRMQFHDVRTAARSPELAALLAESRAPVRSQKASSVLPQAIPYNGLTNPSLVALLDPKGDVLTMKDYSTRLPPRTAVAGRPSTLGDVPEPGDTLRSLPVVTAALQYLIPSAGYTHQHDKRYYSLAIAPVQDDKENVRGAIVLFYVMHAQHIGKGYRVHFAGGKEAARSPSLIRARPSVEAQRIEDVYRQIFGGTDTYGEISVTGGGRLVFDEIHRVKPFTVDGHTYYGILEKLPFLIEHPLPQGFIMKTGGVLVFVPEDPPE